MLKHKNRANDHSDRKEWKLRPVEVPKLGKSGEVECLFTASVNLPDIKVAELTICSTSRVTSNPFANR